MHAELSTPQANQVVLDIAIPPCPKTLTSVLREVSSPTASFATLSQLINRDAGIVAPLLKLANSAHVGLSKKVDSVFQALSVLGMQTTVNLVHNISVRQNIGQNPQHFETFWERSSLEARIAENVASKFPSIKISDAYLATLFHDAAIPILIMRFPKYAEVMKAQLKPGMCVSKTENEVFYTNHAVVGNLLTRNWMLPSHISKAILYHHDLAIFESKDLPEVCDLIGIMHIAQYIADEHLDTEPKEWYRFERAVLKHLELSPQEFSELKSDLLTELRGE